MDKILFIENSILPSRGGIEKVSQLLSDTFVQDGHLCYFAYWHTDNPLIENDRKIRMDLTDSVQSFYARISHFINKNGINIIINQGLTQRRIIYTLKKIKKQNPEIQVINCLHNTPYFINYIKNPTSLKDRIILLIKSILMRGNVYIKEQQLIYSICDNYVVLSPHFIPEAKKVFHLCDDKKLKAIGNPQPFYHSSIAYNKQKTVLIIARFDENQKNLMSALRIWKQVSSEITDWKLQLIGYGEAELMYRQYIKKNNISNIEILGKKEEPLSYYQQASLFMMTSRYEGFSMTLIEALQNQCIPLAFHTFSAIDDIISDGKNGILVPPYDENLYAKRMIELMRNESLINTYRRNAGITLTQYSLDNIKEKWYSLFKEWKTKQ